MRKLRNRLWIILAAAVVMLIGSVLYYSFWFSLAHLYYITGGV